MKTLPKSLHTITVLVRVASVYMRIENYPAADAVGKALEDLGLVDTSDDYGLAAAAVAQLNKKGR